MPSMSHASVTLPIRPLEERSRCPLCGAGADLHQPDVRLPDRLLATCEACGTWSLLLLPHRGRKLAILLPDGAALRARSAPPGPG